MSGGLAPGEIATVGGDEVIAGGAIDLGPAVPSNPQGVNEPSLGRDSRGGGLPGSENAPYF
mgnify:FL=1